MAQKQLHELLQDDQEPFQLKNYIADRRCQLKRPSIPKTNLVQVKKRKPISQKHFCKNACLFSFQNSPDPRKSPLFQCSPPKSPCKSPNAIFLHIPARTAALLLEAAVKVQKQSSSPKTKSQNNGFGLFGTLLKKLTHRNKTRNHEIRTGNHGGKVSVKEILRWNSSVGRGNLSNEIDHRKQEQGQGQEIIMVDTSINEKCGCEMGFNSCCSSHIGRPSSEVWSEKSLDLDFDTSSSTSQYEEDQNIDHFVNKDIIDHGDFASNDKQCFCDSPFHFVLQRSPSTGCRTPDFSSPVTSPSRHIFECKESNGDVESLKKFKEQDEEEEEEEEEDKEQCSPVSVLDPPFEDDDDGNDDHNEDDGFDLECSYAIVQRAKKQLLQKLRRFEKLADLDPVELERRMAEQEEEEEVSDLEEEEQRREDDELISSDREKNIETFILEEIRSKSSFYLPRKIQRDMKRLISDLIVEEGGGNVFYRESMAKRICKRLESWKEVESNTIDMMVGQDFRRELDGWKGNREQVEETALEIELGIVGLLVEELSEELVA